MASSAACSSSVKKQLQDITECPICMETYKDPRSLPCFHTFCLKCVEGFSIDKLPGDDVACPMCRKEFVVPETGVKGLPKNFFIEQLKQEKELSVMDIAESMPTCEGCSADESDRRKKKAVVSFCVECKEKRYVDCVDAHKKVRLSRRPTHTILLLSQDMNSSGYSTVSLASSEKHPSDILRLYCFDCKLVICTTCFVECHRSHKCLDVNQVADEFRRQMTTDSSNMKGCVNRCCQIMKQVLSEKRNTKRNYTKQLCAVERDILTHAEHLKQLIDQQRGKLLLEVQSSYSGRMKQVDNVVAEIEEHMSFVNFLMKFSDELRDKEAASGIAMQSSSLHDRADELLKLDVIQCAVNEMGSAFVKFTAAKTGDDQVLGYVEAKQIAVADEFRRQMTTDSSNMAEYVNRCSEILKQVLSEKDNYTKETSRVEREIIKQAQQLKRLIDQQRDNLLLEVQSTYSSRMKQIDNVIAEIEEHMLFASSLIKYSEELRDKGAASEIARQSSSLHARAGELLKLDVIQRAVNELGSAFVKFTAAKTGDNLVLGYVEKKQCTVPEMSTRPTLTHVIPAAGDQLVEGLTSLNNQLFVIRYPCKEQIEVYDTETFQLQQELRVDELSDNACYQCRLASCATNNCLYVTDCENNIVYRVELTGNKLNDVFKWQVSGGPVGLSVNNACNVLVTCCNANRIQEYTTRGSLVREICLQSDITCPRHTVQLSSGYLVVSHWKPVHGVSIVDSGGRVIASYRNKRRSEKELLNNPAQLAVSNSDCILVADSSNDTMLLLSSLMDKSRVLPVSVEGGLNDPWTVHFDESRGRLYVGESKGGRVLVLDNLTIH